MKTIKDIEQVLLEALKIPPNARPFKSEIKGTINFYLLKNFENKSNEEIAEVIAFKLNDRYKITERPAKCAFSTHVINKLFWLILDEQGDDFKEKRKRQYISYTLKSGQEMEFNDGSDSVEKNILRKEVRDIGRKVFGKEFYDMLINGVSRQLIAVELDISYDNLRQIMVRKSKLMKEILVKEGYKLEDLI